MAPGKTCWQIVDCSSVAVASIGDWRTTSMARQIDCRERTDDWRVINGFSPLPWNAQRAEVKAVTAIGTVLPTTTEITKTTVTGVK
jgi:hypothetical protein